VLLIITFSNGVVKSITPGNGATIVNPGKLYWIFILGIVYVFVLVLVNLISSYKREIGTEKNRVLYLLIGSGVAAAWGILTNAILPAFFPNWHTPAYDSFGVVFLTAMVMAAIIKHKLFDIRLIVARSIGYTLTLSSIALLYIAPAIVITGHLFNTPLKTNSVITLIVVTFIAAVIFQPIRNRFNKISSKLFYRDFYEPQEVLDKLGTLLVGISDINKIIDGSTDILMSAIKPQFIEFILINDDTTNERKDKHKEIISKLSKLKFNTLVSDELQNHKEMYDYLHSNNIALIVKLRTSKEDLGYMLFGYKQSGILYNSNDEKLLGIAADEIAITLQNALHFREIQNFNITLQQKIEDATHQLRQANTKLKQLDETKDDFISMASHQLRTPLSVIKGYVKMVSMGDAGNVNKQQKEFLNQALISSENMVRLVTELLNVSRITSGKFTLEKNEVNLADVVESEITQLSNLAEAKGIVLRYRKPDDFPILKLDEEKTRQVIANFIDNAIHYAKPKNAKIFVELSSEDDIIFKVIDNGIGVPSSEKQHLFSKFYRAKNAKEVRPDGTGVGIYLAKVVIQEQGGELIFQSKEGSGSTFGFKFNKKDLL